MRDNAHELDPKAAALVSAAAEAVELFDADELETHARTLATQDRGAGYDETPDGRRICSACHAPEERPGAGCPGCGWIYPSAEHARAVGLATVDTLTRALAAAPSGSRLDLLAELELALVGLWDPAEAARKLERAARADRLAGDSKLRASTREAARALAARLRREVRL